MFIVPGIDPVSPLSVTEFKGQSKRPGKLSFSLMRAVGTH